jgi:hypothetical protein
MPVALLPGQDFTIDAQLQRCREKLIEVLTPRLKEGNCIITAESAPIKQMGRLYVELYDDGANYTNAGGGLMYASWTMGVAVRSVLVIDSSDEYIASSSDLRLFSRRVRNVLHLFYDSKHFPQPPRATSHTPVRKSRGSRGERVVEFRFEMLSIERYQDIKGPRDDRR